MHYFGLVVFYDVVQLSDCEQAQRATRFVLHFALDHEILWNFFPGFHKFFRRTNVNLGTDLLKLRKWKSQKIGQLVGNFEKLGQLYEKLRK